MILASFSLIYGLSLGLEYVDAMPEEGIGNSIILDFFIFRFIFSFT
jgi:hypothetical protein